jgi:type IV pilus assembly protein PilW
MSAFATIRARPAGLSLVELMVSLVLGLLVIGGASTVFLSNRQTYRATENLSRMQESARVAFELMARDLREAGGNACERDLPVVNVLNNADDDWWSTWTIPVRGFAANEAFPDAAFGTDAEERVDGTDALEIRSAISAGVTVDDHQPDSAQFKVNTVDHGLDDGDIVMVCDFDHAAIFQITNAQPGTNNTVVHNSGTGDPGNESTCLAVDTETGCPSGTVKTYSFGCFEGKSQAGACVDPRNWPAQIAKLQAFRWYVGNNARGGRSLFRTGLENDGGVISPSAVEIADNIDDMDLTYLTLGGDEYEPAGAVDWNNVGAVRIELTLLSPERVATDGGRLTRSLRHIVALRNRTP